jgi:hypothetical protein
MKQLCLPLLLLLSIALHSQSFNGGVLGGITTSQVDGDGYGGYRRAGLVAGAWVDRDFWPEVSLRTELKVVRKGSYQRFTDGYGGTIGFYSLGLTYVEMPLLAEYHFRDDIIPFGGLSAGYLWKVTERNADGPFPSEDFREFRKAEFAVNLGVEYKINTRFSFCAHFTYSILPVRLHTGGVGRYLNWGQHNNVLQFYVKYGL